MAEFDRKIYDMIDHTQDKARMGQILIPLSQSEREKWIAKRKETWRFHQELLKSMTYPSRKGYYSRTIKAKICVPTKSKEMQALFKELKVYVESKRTQDEESGLFIPRQMLLSSVQNFEETLKFEDSPKHSACPDLVQTFDTTGDNPRSPADDTYIQSEVKRSKRPSLKQRIFRFFGLK